MSISEVSGGCTSVEDGIMCITPCMTIKTAATPAPPVKLGHRTRRHGQYSPTNPSATTRRKAGDTASARRIRVVGRFASPSCSRETSPIDGGYNSSDSDDPCPTLRNTLQPRLVPNEDPNDADDEAEINKELAERGRSRVIRRVSVSSR